MQSRQELVLMFMLALTANPSYGNPELILKQAGILADLYLCTQ